MAVFLELLYIQAKSVLIKPWYLIFRKKKKRLFMLCFQDLFMYLKGRVTEEELEISHF